MSAHAASAASGVPNDTPHADSPPAVTFVACGARSGSTLLRWLLDSHPQIACPGEGDVALLLESYIQTATALSAPPSADEASTLARARAAADDLIAACLAATGKTRYCDKSLSNVLHLELLASAWPDARFIMLYRHCMDFVMSAIEASPWGLREYGFAEFAEKSPTDNVVALAAYWLDRTGRMLSFEERRPGQCLRLRYEDLVKQPDDVLGDICKLIAVPPAAGLASTAFELPHDPSGAADHKVWYTHAVHEESVGRGARVPPQHLTGALRAAVNELLERLDYPTVDDFWGSGGAGARVSTGVGKERPERGSRHGSTLVELRILEGHAPLWCGVVDLAAPAPTSGESATAHGPQPGASRVVVVERATLAAICAGSQNVGAALRARTMRSYGPSPRNFADERATYQRLADFLAVAGAELLGADGRLARTGAAAVPTSRS
ncbi:MAG: sulfotransferase [Solirubrobacteraceae bacterium]|jgi:hypothetical protein